MCSLVLVSLHPYSGGHECLTYLLLGSLHPIMGATSATNTGRRMCVCA